MNLMPPAYEGDKPYIFISYAHKDTDKVIPAIKGLQEVGYPVWYDAGIQVGSEWPDYIAEHLLGSSLVIAFISEASIASDNCRQEIVYALDKHKHVLTVRLDESKLKPGMEMQLNLCQSLLAFKHSTIESYVDELARAPFIAQCLSMEQPDIPPRPSENDTVTHKYNTPKSEGNNFSKSFKDISHKVGDAFQHFNDTQDTTSQYDEEDIGANKLFAVTAYLNILILVSLFAYKKSAFVRFHTNQGLVLFVAFVVLRLATALVSFMSDGFLGFLSPILSIMYLAYIAIGIVNAVKGRAKILPLIGNIKILKHP